MTANAKFSSVFESMNLYGDFSDGISEQTVGLKILRKIFLDAPFIQLQKCHRT